MPTGSVGVSWHEHQRHTENYGRIRRFSQILMGVHVCGVHTLEPCPVPFPASVPQVIRLLKFLIVYRS